MAKYRIEHDREGCIGCGACAGVCPENWEMAADGKSRLLKADVDELGCNEQAAEGCPVNVIHITETGAGKKIY